MKKSFIIFALGIFFLCQFSAEVKADIHPVKAKILKKTYSINELKKNLEYDFAKSTIRNNYNDRLDQLAKLIITKNCVIALRGHADSIGTYKGNWMLSQKRADAVKDYLVKSGVTENKIVVVAFGSTIPVASNKTAEGRQKNRRVEIILKDLNN